MAATLKMCIMVHVEEDVVWDVPDAKKAKQIAQLASAVGQHGAKLSLQIGRKFVDPDFGYNGFADPPPYGTSLSAVLTWGGNFWVHCHAGSALHLRSTYACVRSAWCVENTAGPQVATGAANHVSGRSGGWDGDADWVLITQAEGLRRMNSAVMMSHLLVPTSKRPYGFVDEELQQLYGHDAAPGPIHVDVATMRQRPFWMRTSSGWFDATTDIYPSTTYVDSVMMIPQAGRFGFGDMADRRSASPDTALTVEDLNACLTEIWTTFQLMTYQQSITNVWYKHLERQYFDDDATIQTIAAWVQTVNAVIVTPGYGEWRNMNEIADLFSHATSFYW